jgi:hypothetical protein
LPLRHLATAGETGLHSCRFQAFYVAIKRQVSVSAIDLTALRMSDALTRSSPPARLVRLGQRAETGPT